LSAKRILIFAAVMAGLAAFAVLYPPAFVFSLVVTITAIYTAWGVYHLIITLYGLNPPLNPAVKKLDDYPKISVIIPARNEPILGRTIEVCVNHVDYPLDKKEIIAVVDDEGGERIAFWYQQRYPETVKLLARRQLFPTKPSALNDAMRLCTGDIVVVMDVEDIPDRDVFLKAAAAIKSGWQAVQVILRIGNTDDSWISMVFGMEYAGWFRIMLNGRVGLSMFAPLGGTGNYFSRAALRYVGGYEPTNLAEDAELAIRLRIARWNVGTIDARHWEEAPVTFNESIKHRSRWFRRWMQSFWKYSGVLFKPSVARRMGIAGIFSTLVMLVSPLIVVLNWIAYGMTAYWALEITGAVPRVTAGVIPFWSIIPLWFNALYYYIWIKGAKLEGIKFKTVKYLPHMFFYMNVMMPIASLRAFSQELFKPVFWEKTTHQGRGVKWKAAQH
jgi:cellulose synthase/poly-beta-1,6-N-acetylglucosamine synthase-like glycosyltransferase